MAGGGPWHLVVVPHTHWDREWYRTHEQFRVRLVRLVDRLLDALERDPAFRHFTLDGQTIVVDDYLAVRPEARDRIVKLVEAGRLSVGPWTVLPDEWLVSGEALVRNLRKGLLRAEALGGAMRLGYVPDQFGHVGQLPQIFRGFGLEAGALWRGVGADVEETLFAWEAPDGSRLFTVYLARSYSNAAHLPATPDAAAARLAREVRGLGKRSRIPSLLLMNGTDHAEPDPELPRLLEAARGPLEAAVGPVEWEIGSLPRFVERARGELEGSLPVHRGELRSGLRAHLLPGCASARMPQKRRDFENDRLLTAYLEPLSAWWGALGGAPDPGLIAFAWSVALENHPHDSICGCSIDAVHAQMEPRFDRVEEIARAELERVVEGLAEQVAPPSGGAGPALLVWSPAPPGRAPVEAEVEWEGPVPRTAGSAVPLHVRDAEGRRLAARGTLARPPERLLELELPARVAAGFLGQIASELMGERVRALGLERDAGGGRTLRIALGRVVPADFDLEARSRELAAELAEAGDATVRVEAFRPARVRVRFADALPGYGLRVYRVAAGRAHPPGELESGRPARSGAAGGAWIANRFWRVEADAAGRLAFVRREDGRRVEDAFRLVSEGDRGDEYNFDPVPGGAAVERPERARVRLERGGGAELALRIDARYRVPAGLAPDRARRSEREVPLPVRLRVSLHAGVDRVDVAVELENTARDHRLRAVVRAPFRARRLEVESAFEVAERPLEPASEPADRPPAEPPVGAGPVRRFASLAEGREALTVATRGLSEVEGLPEAGGAGEGSGLAVTLLRSVGWLSRGDLALRPAHAGPPLETPGAQVPGPHRAELSIRWHPDGAPERTAEAHRFAVPPLALEAAPAGAGPLADGARLLELDDPEAVLSAVEPRPGREAVLRLWNATARARELELAWRGAPARGLEALRLDERPDPEAAPLRAGEAGRVRLALGPARIATLRVRPG